MNFWVFRNNQHIIACGSIPTIYSISAKYSQLICNELNSRNLQQTSIKDNDIYVNNTKAASIITKSECTIQYIYSIYNYENQEIQVKAPVKTPVIKKQEVINTPKQTITIEEIPIDETPKFVSVVEEVKEEEPVVEQVEEKPQTKKKRKRKK